MNVLVLHCQQAAWLTAPGIHSLSTGSLAHRAKNVLAGSALEAPTCLNGIPVASARVPVPNPVAIMVMLTCSRERGGNVIAVCRAAKQVHVGRPTPASDWLLFASRPKHAAQITPHNQALGDCTASEQQQHMRQLYWGLSHVSYRQIRLHTVPSTSQLGPLANSQRHQAML